MTWHAWQLVAELGWLRWTWHVKKPQANIQGSHEDVHLGAMHLLGENAVLGATTPSIQCCDACSRCIWHDMHHRQQ